MLCEILSVMVVVVCVRSYIIYVYCVYIGRYWVLTRVCVRVLIFMRLSIIHASSL